jgi:hypothetical protein
VKVRDLREQLDHLPQGATVYLAKDAEGNEFSLLEEFDPAYVRISDVDYGRTDTLLYSEDLDELSTEEIREDLEEVVVLWPV